jgi:hypothetical protein
MRFLALNGRGDILSDYEFIALSETAAVDPTWLWKDWIPLGATTLVEGDPGSNKTTLLNEICSRVTTGRSMPDGSPGIPTGSVMLWQAEDTVSRLHRNLDAAGADLAKIYVVDKLAAGTPMLPDAMRFLEGEVGRRGVKLLVIDPVTAHVNVNINCDQGVRQVMTPLASLAERADIAIVLVRHLRKSSSATPLYRGAGSIALIGACRSSLLVAMDPGNPERRVLAAVKSSLAAKPPSLSFRPVTRGDGLGIEFLAPSDYSAEQLLAASNSHSRCELEEAIFALYSILGDGSLPVNEAKKLAREAGITDRTLRRAKELLRVTSKREGFGPGSRFRWVLPQQHEMVARLRNQDLDALADELFHGKLDDERRPDDPRTFPTRGNDHPPENKPNDDDFGGSRVIG